mmetsp:Transcript_43209/g.119490  ORF Transcript_43209/g.119490 Transcript_43209/m.119490 type:complete len:293 (-) Transcript_43209:219-1097(-)
MSTFVFRHVGPSALCPCASGAGATVGGMWLVTNSCISSCKDRSCACSLAQHSRSTASPFSSTAPEVWWVKSAPSPPGTQCDVSLNGAARRPGKLLVGVQTVELQLVPAFASSATASALSASASLCSKDGEVVRSGSTRFTLRIGRHGIGTGGDAMASPRTGTEGSEDDGHKGATLCPGTLSARSCATKTGMSRNVFSWFCSTPILQLARQLPPAASPPAASVAPLGEQLPHGEASAPKSHDVGNCGGHRGLEFNASESPSSGTRVTTLACGSSTWSHGKSKWVERSPSAPAA